MVLPAKGRSGKDVEREDMEMRTDKKLLFLVVSCWSQ